MARFGGIPNFRNIKKQLDLGGGLPSLARLKRIGNKAANNPIEMTAPVAKNPIKMGLPSTQWWEEDGYNSIQEAIQSGNYTFKMGKGFVKNPDAVTPAMEEAAAVEKVTVTDMETGLPVEPPPAYKPPVSAVLKNIGTSATTPPEVVADPVTAAVEAAVGGGAIGSESRPPPKPYVASYETEEFKKSDEEQLQKYKDRKAAKKDAKAAAEAEGLEKGYIKEFPTPAVNPVTEVVNPVTEAVETAVGGGTTTTAPPVEEIIAPTMAPPEIEKIEQAIAQLPPEVIPQVIPQLPPEVIPEIVPQLPPEVIAQVVPQLPPEVIQQLPPEVVADPVTTAVNAAVGGGSTATAPPPATMGASSSADLGTLGTSGVATMDSPPVQMGEQTIRLPGGQTVVIPSQEEIMANIAKMRGEPEVVQETAQTEPVVDPVTAAVNTAVGGGAPVAPPAVAQSAMANLPVTMGAVSSPTLGNLDREPIERDIGVRPATMGEVSSPLEEILMPESVSPIAESGISENILAAAMAPPSQETINADIAKLMGMEPQVSVDTTQTETVDPVTAAVETAVGNGQPTTDDTILDPDDMPIYLDYMGTDEGGDYRVSGGKKTYIKDMPNLGGIADTDTTDTTETDTETPAQPDFMTQLQELIAQMQGEQTAVAEAAAAAEAERQKQAAEMTQNYMVGQPAVGYNPYQSGQYQNNPYGAAGVPNMGGITSIPVPAPYQAPRTMT